jgi:hypothetical protein
MEQLKVGLKFVTWNSKEVVEYLIDSEVLHLTNVLNMKKIKRREVGSPSRFRKKT